MGCRFCLTGRMGLVRNLTPAEIVGQVAAVREQLIGAGVVRPTTRQLVDNLVFMGMGEPLANYDNLITALAILQDEAGPGFSERRVTVSTCGLAARIEGSRARRPGEPRRLAAFRRRRDAQCADAGQPGVRRRGAARGVPPVHRRREAGRLRRVAAARGSERRAGGRARLAERLRDLPCRVNLLAYNESPALPYRSLDRGAGRGISGHPPRRGLPDADQAQPRRRHRGRVRAAGGRRHGAVDAAPAPRGRAGNSVCVAGARVLLMAHRARAPVAQLDRASDFESDGRGFESLRARQHNQWIA